MTRQDIEAAQAEDSATNDRSRWYAIERRGLPPMQARLYAVNEYVYADTRLGRAGLRIHGCNPGDRYMGAWPGDEDKIEAVCTIDTEGQPLTVWLAAVLGEWTAEHQAQVDDDRAARKAADDARAARGAASLAALLAANPPRNP